MRCGCPDCDGYMTHAESLTLGCVCPKCGSRCTACLGVPSAAVSDALRALHARFPEEKPVPSPVSDTPSEPVVR